MDLTAPAAGVMEAIDALRDAVAAEPVVVPEGSRTQWAVGGVPDGIGVGRAVQAPRGEIRHDPADLTVTVPAGTTVGELAHHLSAHGQECPLDPRSPDATVGGVLAAGLSGHRRLRYGPLRDRVLEVRVVLGDGRLVKGGGPTVKNVSGYDLVRLFVGSLGTLGVIVQATLRCVPQPRRAVWATGSDADPSTLHRRLTRPACIAWNGEGAVCLLEGHPEDIESELATASLTETTEPSWPDGPYRARASIRPGEVVALGRALSGISGLQWMAEVGVGTMHVAACDVEPVLAAREAAHERGGWLLREAGDDALHPFGRPIPNAILARRIKDALDPAGKMNPGRLPL